MSDIIRVVRLIEYVGPREDVEKQVAASIHGTRIGMGTIVIRATTLGMFPDLLITDGGSMWRLIDKIAQMPHSEDPGDPMPFEPITNLQTLDSLIHAARACQAPTFD